GVPLTPWADVLASIEEAVVVLDRSGAVAGLNPAAEELTGMSTAHAATLTAEALFRSNPWIAELVRGTLAEGAARRRGEGRLVSRQGDVPVSAACAPVVDADGVARGAVLVLRDLGLQQTLEATTRR